MVDARYTCEEFGYGLLNGFLAQDECRRAVHALEGLWHEGEQPILDGGELEARVPFLWHTAVEVGHSLVALGGIDGDLRMRLQCGGASARRPRGVRATATLFLTAAAGDQVELRAAPRLQSSPAGLGERVKAALCAFAPARWILARPVLLPTAAGALLVVQHDRCSVALLEAPSAATRLRLAFTVEAPGAARRTDRSRGTPGQKPPLRLRR